ncbi:MAG TPA: DUF3306 domain-containing protein [Kiloniellaceae bacterium]|nr:DUF3306 domain-containing protein [Kiloniellaceae bacterium]
MSDDETFLGRWARRKRGAAKDAPETTRPARRMAWRLPPDPDEAAETPTVADRDDATLPLRPDAPEEQSAAAFPEAPATEADNTEGDPEVEAALPPIESLDYDSDYRGFFAEGVSDALRRQALRQLWRSNPVLANVDGLNDYDGDFTDAAMVRSGLKSAFDALRGYADKEAPPETVSDLDSPAEKAADRTGLPDDATENEVIESNAADETTNSSDDAEKTQKS